MSLYRRVWTEKCKNSTRLKGVKRRLRTAASTWQAIFRIFCVSTKNHPFSSIHPVPPPISSHPIIVPCRSSKSRSLSFPRLVLSRALRRLCFARNLSPLCLVPLIPTVFRTVNLSTYPPAPQLAPLRCPRSSSSLPVRQLHFLHISFHPCRFLLTPAEVEPDFIAIGRPRGSDKCTGAFLSHRALQSIHLTIYPFVIFLQPLPLLDSKDDSNFTSIRFIHYLVPKASSLRAPLANTLPHGSKKDRD